MDEHPSREELSALLREGLPAERMRKVVAHLLTCGRCLDQAPPPLGILLTCELERFAPPDEVFQSVWAAPSCENHLIPEGRSPKNLKEAI